VLPYATKRSSAGAWWMPILEKGWAKFMQNYFAINGGVERVALRALTGMPVKRFKTATMTEEHVQSIIRAGDEAHYVMTAACYVDDHNKAAFEEHGFHGLVTGHAYTVIGFNSYGKRVQMRNPWAAEKYHG
jgi:hypothetical protein